MQNIKVKRYKSPKTRRFWEGWIEPDDGSWILFIPGPEEASQRPHLHIPEDSEPVEMETMESSPSPITPIL